MKYFVEIVNCKCNLSVASKKLYISQPALSSIIKNFEAEENVQLFQRYKGKLQSLTPEGEIFYKNAILIIDNYKNMINELREGSGQYRGKVKIGIPPLILSTTFSNVLPNIMLENPDIEVEIIEMGAYELRKSLLSKNLDFAVLLQPTYVSNDMINEYLLQENELAAFMNIHSPLAKNDMICWKKLNGHPMAIFNDSFMIHHQLIDKFKSEDVKPKIVIESSYWDFLMFSVKNPNILTILPSPVKSLINMEGIVEKSFYNPIPWKVVLCQIKKKKYSHLEDYILKLILDYKF